MTIRNIFAINIVGEFIILPGGSRVDAEFFADLFSAAPSNPTYDDLVAIDGGDKGYIPFFDQCKAEGILI